MSSYSTSETEAEVEVCVTLSGELGTDITLQLDTVSGTAEGEYSGVCSVYQMLG